MTILGISCFYHDASAVLLRDGQVVAGCAEERFSRIKHDPGFPAQAVDFCFSTAGITASDVDYIFFYENPFLKFECIILNIVDSFSRSCLSFRESMVAWLNEKLWIRQILREKTGISEQRIFFCEHHQSPAASAFLCPPTRMLVVLIGMGILVMFVNTSATVPFVYVLF